MSVFSSTRSFIRRHRWMLLIASILVLIIGGIVYSAGKPKQPEYVTTPALKGDLKQTVEAVGTVVSERDLGLQFPTSGVVAQVYVTEGATVRAGQALAALRSGNVAADIAAASARLQSAQADLQKLYEGNRPEDIAIAEAEVQNKRASLDAARASLANAERVLDQSQVKLDALRREASVSVSGQISTIGSTVRQQLSTAQTALSSIEDVFGNNDVQDAILKSAPEKYDQVVRQKNAAYVDVSTAIGAANSPADFEAALLLIKSAREKVANAWNVVGSAYDAIQTLQTTGSFDNSDKEGYKATLATERSSLQSALGTLDSTAQTLRDAVAGIDTKIAAEEASITSAQGSRDRALADIATYETSLKISEAQLSLKKAGTRQSDINAALARVRQEQASLQRARADYSNTVLTAPINGVVTKVNVKTGEFTPAGPAVTMLGETPFRVEMFVSEIDVPKVQTTQTGSIELDAFRGTHFKLRVSQIDTAPTDRDGVSKYRVKLDFIYPHNELKIGMTGDAEIVTGMRPAVVSVPQRAIIEDANSGSYVRVLNADGTVTNKVVQTGMEGEGGNIEVNGIAEGDTVIVLVKE